MLHQNETLLGGGRGTQALAQRLARLLVVGTGLALILAGAARAQSYAGSKPTDDSAPSDVPLSVAAKQSFDWLVAHCTYRTPVSDFWRNPDADGVGTDQNGWQGAQGMQSAVINYEATHDAKYLNLIENFAEWVEHVYPGRDRLSLCGTFASYDLANNKGVGPLPPHFSMWNDDAGWVMNMYLEFYRYTQRAKFLQTGYETLLNGDKYWGEDFQGNSRGLRYKDREDDYPIYMAAQIVGALGLAEAEREAGDATKAAAAMTLAEKYDNFVENYLHSTGPGGTNITGTPFTSPRDIYEIGASFGTGMKSPAPDAKSKLHAAFFTTPHMLMAAAYIMFDDAAAKGADISLVDSRFRNFHERALAAADAFTTAYPEGYLESGHSVDGQVMIDAADPNVNGFGCYWWAKYVVPLNPDRYGKVIIQTARQIVADKGTGNLSNSIWNAPKGTKGQGKSHSTYADAGEWIMVRDASACSILAAPNWIDKMSNPNSGLDLR